MKKSIAEGEQEIKQKYITIDQHAEKLTELEHKLLVTDIMAREQADKIFERIFTKHQELMETMLHRQADDMRLFFQGLMVGRSAQLGYPATAQYAPQQAVVYAQQPNPYPAAAQHAPPQPNPYPATPSVRSISSSKSAP